MAESAASSGQARMVRAGHIELSVMERGRGMPLVLVHGFPLDRRMWDAQIEHFAKRRRVIAPDLRGFGSSPPVQGATSIEQMADDLDALLTALGVDQPVVLCGLSMGGYVAFQFWRKYSARLRGLVLCDTRAVADTSEGAQGRLKQAELVAREGTAPLVETMLPKLLAPSTLSTRPLVAELVQTMILAASREGVVAALKALAARPDVRGYLPRIKTPTLVVVGQHDAISTPAEMRLLAQAMPRAEFVMIEDCGHMSPMENPSSFNRAVETYLSVLA